MSDPRNDDFDDRFDRFDRLDAAMLQRLDQELQEVRSLYDKLDDGERERYQLWLRRVTEVDADRLLSLPSAVMIHTAHVVHDDDENVVYEGHAELAPSVLLSAVDAWSRGQDFLPGTWRETS